MKDLKYYQNKKSVDNEEGYIALVTLIILTLASLVVTSSLDQVMTSSKTVSNKKIKLREEMRAQAAIKDMMSFMRKYSQQIVTPFRRAEFYNKFVKTSPTVGANDSGSFNIPTMIKVKGTNDSAILTNDVNVVTPSFPQVVDITTNTVFDPQATLAAESFRDMKVRVTLINAIADDPTKDYGAGGATPETDFYPIYRIDAFAGVDKGAHFYSYFKGDATHVFDMGLFGQDYLELRQPCDSYLSADGAYSNGSKRAKCPVGSNSTSAVHKNEEVYGSLRTNGSINASPPFGGDTCADFSCTTAGETCSGEDCGVPLLEIFKDWDEYCPSGTEQSLVNVNSSTTMLVASDAATDRCWSGVKIRSGRTLTLKTTATPYYFNSIDIANTGVLRAEPDDPTKAVEVYVETIVGNKFNGNQYTNPGGDPSSLKIYYIGTTDIVFNGNADVYAAFVAPKAAAIVQGNFDFFGALLAKELHMTGNGDFHYDESLGGQGEISDMQYSIEELSQYFR